jgi:hypothetical protein
VRCSVSSSPAGSGGGGGGGGGGAVTVGQSGFLRTHWKRHADSVLRSRTGVLLLIGVGVALGCLLSMSLLGRQGGTGWDFADFLLPAFDLSSARFMEVAVWQPLQCHWCGL